MNHRSQTRRPPIRSLTGWIWNAPEDEEWGPDARVEKLLERARAEGIVADFVVGRCCLWFTAAAGPAARALRDQVEKLIPGWKRAAR